MVRIVNMRFLLSGSIAIYALYFFMIARKAETTKYKVTFTFLLKIVFSFKKSESVYRFHD